MLNFESLESIPVAQFERGTVVAIGKFDGVHVGHQALLRRAVETAAARDLDPVVFTFAENPQQVLNPQRQLPAIMSHEQRLEALAAAGIEACVMVPFNGDLAAMSPEDFAREVLARQLRAHYVVVGPGFRFGRGGAGDTDMLACLGEQLGFDVDIIGKIGTEGVSRVSSSEVRDLIQRGEVAEAAGLLGRPAEIWGTVIRGDARGRELGFPTANLGEVAGLVPAEGIYAARVRVGDSWHPAAVSVGNNPTFTPEGDLRVEAFIMDFSEEIYGEHVAVQFIERLRGNVAFSGIEALVEQMTEDVARARAILGAG